MRSLFNIKKTDRIFYISCFVSFLVLALIVFLLPEGFTEYKNSDRLAPFWYFMTFTGGVYGASAVILMIIFYLSPYFKTTSLFRKNAVIFITTIIFVQSLISASTLYYFKDVFRNPRPSQLYFIQKGILKDNGKEFFAMPMEEKSNYIRQRVDSSRGSFGDIYPPVLESWIYESGYSFPSGHAQTSFFLGTVLSFVLFKTRKKKHYFIYPLVWAVLVALSRVLIGVHFPLDVAAGALMSMITALIIVSLKKFNTIFE